MNWDAIGAFGEILGAVAVVVTLIYLAAQIRHSGLEARAGTIQAALELEMHLSEVLAQHGGTWDKVVKGAHLADGEELRTAVILYNLTMIEAENRFHQYQAGYLDAKSWDGRLGSLHRLVKLPIHATWQRSMGALNHSSEFLDVLKGLSNSTD